MDRATVAACPGKAVKPSPNAARELVESLADAELQFDDGDALMGALPGGLRGRGGRRVPAQVRVGGSDRAADLTAGQRYVLTPPTRVWLIT
jgi:hypothetical protein